ncbi:prosaposin-like isoform X2 [Tubulanus polymorphus]|uniref:prosaposin-like isoform X2 n=1 Tax=Tubulanus polymorphus TaxID=672921 RepID=UPI003DA474FB
MMKILIIFAVLTASASASPLLGTDRCTWGPSYWCSHISHASECRAVNHCIDTVWSKQQLPTEQNNGEICTLCEGVIAQVKQMLLDPNADAQVKSFLDKSCTLLPAVQSQRQCKQIVDTYYNEVIQMIKSKLLPHQICAALKLCPAVAAGKTTPKRESSLKFTSLKAPTAKCEMCKIAIQKAKAMFDTKKSQAEITAFIKNELCTRLGPEQQACDSLVDQYGNLIFQLLANEIDPEQICHAIGLCTTATKSSSNTVMAQLPPKTPAQSPKKPKAVKTSAECVMCEFMVGELEKLLGDKRSEAAIAEALDKVCGLLPATVTDECKQLVQIYTPMIIQYLLKGMTPDQLCVEMRLCTAAASLLKVNVQRIPGVKQTAQCVACEFVIKTLDGMLTKNATEQQIVRALDRVCTLMPKTVRAECQSYVNAYAPALIQLLASDIDPQQICTFLGVCSPAVKKHQPTRQQTPVKAGPTCVLCEFVMKELDGLLLKNATEQDIIAALDKVCSLLPSTISGQCESFVNQYAPLIIKLLINDFAPGVICKQLGLCTAVQTQVRASGEVCQLCKTVMSYLAMLLKEQSTVQTIDHAVERVCNFLPAAMKKPCDDMIEQYGPFIIQKLDQQLINPADVCAEIRLCTAAKKPTIGLVHLLGGEKCTYGPAYWCASVQNAKRCQAMEHCQTHVWTRD